MTVIKAIRLKPELTLTQLFERYLEFKKPVVKPTTFHYLVTSIQADIDRCPYQGLSEDDALQVRTWLLADSLFCQGILTCSLRRGVLRVRLDYGQKNRSQTVVKRYSVSSFRIQFLVNF